MGRSEVSASQRSLALDEATVQFGGLKVLDSVSVSFGDSPMNVLIGPNGAGKTTLLNALSGVVRPVRGTLHLDGEDVTGYSAMKLARMGVVRKFQVPTVFPGMSVRDNLKVAALAPRHGRQTTSTGGVATEIDELLASLHLQQRSRDLAAELSHGERQWLEIGMAFLGRPRFLLLDEPAAGLGPGETQHTANLIKKMSTQCCVLVIEHDMEFVRALGGVVTVLHQGTILTTGSMAEIEADPTVRDVYLGRGHNADD
jgi:urea transport system ATP-binding protein